MHPIRAAALALTSLFSLAAGCQGPARGSPPQDYVLVLLERSSAAATKTPDERRVIQDAHLANIGRLAEEGTLLVAGPFGPGQHDPNLRGLFVFDVTSTADADALAATDPAIQAGVLSARAIPFRSDDAPRRAAAIDRERRLAAEREGRVLKMGEGIRAYVMIHAHDAERAERALAPVGAKVLWHGRLGGELTGQALFLIDARDLAEADALLGEARAELGEAWIDPWWSSTSHAELHAAAGAVP